MLTQKDLSQIKKIFQPINDKLIEHDKKFGEIDKEFKSVNKQLKKIQKDLTVTIKYFDNNSINHEKRITKIEKHLGFSQFSQ